MRGSMSTTNKKHQLVTKETPELWETSQMNCDGIICLETIFIKLMVADLLFFCVYVSRLTSLNLKQTFSWTLHIAMKLVRLISKRKKDIFFGCHYERGPFLEDNLSVECYPMFHNVIKALERWVNTTIFPKMQPVNWEIVLYKTIFDGLGIILAPKK